MSIKSLIQASFPILNEMPLLDEMEKYCLLKNYPTDSNLIDIGSDLIYMPLLISGNIKIVREDKDGNELLLYYITGGETCASTLACCFNRVVSEVRATVLEDVLVIMVPIRCMDEWLRKYNSWRNFIMQSYRTRFEELLQTIDSIAFMKMDERLEKYLYQHTIEINKPVFLGTHQEIASDLNTSREVISRLLKQLEKMGRIKLSRNKIEIISLV